MWIAHDYRPSTSPDLGTQYLTSLLGSDFKEGTSPFVDTLGLLVLPDTEETKNPPYTLLRPLHLPKQEYSDWSLWRRKYRRFFYWVRSTADSGHRSKDDGFGSLSTGLDPRGSSQEAVEFGRTPLRDPRSHAPVVPGRSLGLLLPDPPFGSRVSLIFVHARRGSPESSVNTP